MFTVSKRFRLSMLGIQSRPFYSSRIISSNKSHSADHYSKDVDTNPPSDPTMHRVDAGSENAQRPHEPPSGKWSQAGTQTNEYRTVDKEEPYDVPGKNKGAKTGYGAVKDSREKASRTGTSDDGPDAKDAGGRK